MGSARSGVRHITAYVVFGVLTTAVNVGVYAALTKAVHLDYLVANVVAWIASVAFAFVTNKFWVFDSRSTDRRTIAYEVTTFTGSRLASGVLDMAMMFVLVGVLHAPDLISKVADNVVVVIVNYVLSRLVVFRKRAA